MPSSPRWGMARVHGHSMEPTLQPGDRLLLRMGRAPRAGQVVVIRLPDGTLAVKRAGWRHGAGWWVLRDNPMHGTDSALVGEIPEADVIAVAWARLWPRPGPIPPAPPPL